MPKHQTICKCSSIIPNLLNLLRRYVIHPGQFHSKTSFKKGHQTNKPVREPFFISATRNHSGLCPGHFSLIYSIPEWRRFHKNQFSKQFISELRKNSTFFFYLQKYALFQPMLGVTHYKSNLLQEHSIFCCNKILEGITN